MPVLTDRDFASYAEKVARELVEQKTPLKTSVMKIAQEEDLNAEQLARLCEAANNAAFSAHFTDKGKQGSDDRLVDFDVVSAKELLQGEMAASKTASAPPIVSDWDAAWESRSLVTPEVFTEKTASLEELAAEAQRPGREKRAAERRERTSYKLASELRIRVEEHKLALTGHVEKLAHEFRRLYGTPYEAFEKEALDAYGVQAHAPLNTLRAALRKPEFDFYPVKTASYPDTSTMPHRTFQALLTELDSARTTMTRLAALKE